MFATQKDVISELTEEVDDLPVANSVYSFHVLF